MPARGNFSGAGFPGEEEITFSVEFFGGDVKENIPNYPFDIAGKNV